MRLKDQFMPLNGLINITFLGGKKEWNERRKRTKMKRKVISPITKSLFCAGVRCDNVPSRVVEMWPSSEYCPASLLSANSAFTEVKWYWTYNISWISKRIDSQIRKKDRKKVLKIHLSKINTPAIISFHAILVSYCRWLFYSCVTSS